MQSTSKVQNRDNQKQNRDNQKAARSLSLSALGYQSSLERLLADIVNELNSFQYSL